MKSLLRSSTARDKLENERHDAQAALTAKECRPGRQPWVARHETTSQKGPKTSANVGTAAPGCPPSAARRLPRQAEITLTKKGAGRLPRHSSRSARGNLAKNPHLHSSPESQNSFPHAHLSNRLIASAVPDGRESGGHLLSLRLDQRWILQYSHMTHKDMPMNAIPVVRIPHRLAGVCWLPRRCIRK
jgi:hypothetical protein